LPLRQSSRRATQVSPRRTSGPHLGVLANAPRSRRLGQLPRHARVLGPVHPPCKSGEIPLSSGLSIVWSDRRSAYPEPGAGAT
jgi:hypothetical protein